MQACKHRLFIVYMYIHISIYLDLDISMCVSPCGFSAAGRGERTALGGRNGRSHEWNAISKREIYVYIER